MGDEFSKGGKSKGDREVGGDARGGNVWEKPIQDVELELVSTAKLKLILDSGDKEQKDRIRELADGEDGVLARSIETNQFEILRDDAFTIEPVDAPDGDQEDSLVTTQSLRKILKIESEPEVTEPDVDDGDRGYNPYDSGPPKG